MQAQLPARCSAPTPISSHHCERRFQARGDAAPCCAPLPSGHSSGATRRQRRAPFAPAHGASQWRRPGVQCQATEGDGQGDAPVKDRITSTLSGLDLLLGIDPEEAARKKARPIARMPVLASIGCWRGVPGTPSLPESKSRCPRAGILLWLHNHSCSSACGADNVSSRSFSRCLWLPLCNARWQSPLHHWRHRQCEAAGAM